MTDSGYDRTRPRVHLRIGGERLDAGSGGTFEHVDPCTGEVDALVPLAGPAEADRAVRLAHEAYLRWRDVGPPEKPRRTGSGPTSRPTTCAGRTGWPSA